MNSRQKWIFDNFKLKLSALEPEVRSKAVQIAERLIDEEGQNEEKAMENAIKRAEEWYLDTRG